MKYVILITDGQESAEAAGSLSDVLRGAGVVVADLNGDAPPVSAPLAVVCSVRDDADVAELHALIERARSASPGAPIVACRCEAATVSSSSAAGRDDDGDSRAQSPHAFDVSALMRFGFAAVADRPAQLPALLRGLEEQGQTGELRIPKDAPTATSTPASLLLPESLDVNRLRAAFDAVASLHFAADQRSAAQTAIAGLAALVRADRWTIYLCGGDEPDGSGRGCALEPLATRGLTASEREIPEGDWRRSLMGDALSLAGAESRAAQEAVAQAETVKTVEGARRVVAVPLVSSGERVMGIVEAVREGEDAQDFSDPDAALLSALALPLAAALANSARISEAERLSQTDDLTKLHNARFLRQFIISEVKRARRYGSSVTAIFLDLDDFKRVNDHHGHLVGSHVLMEMASVILACVRDTDVVARYGGDEFVVILPETALERAMYVAERVRDRIAGHAFTGGRPGLRLSLTASFGVANFPEHAQSPQQLIAAADTAMYQAKAARKNCVHVSAGG